MMFSTALLLQQTASVIILGTGTPNPDPERSGPAVAVVINQTAYLVDAGPGVVRRAAAAETRYTLPSLKAERLGIVFITHLHSDHTVGLPDLIHTGWVADRATPLQVYGPRGIREMAEHLTLAWSRDIQVRTEGEQPHTRDGWKVEAHEVSAGAVYRDSNVTVSAIPIPHTNWDQAFAYRFETRDRVFVISGDGRPTPAVAEACSGCDLLVHEVYSAERFKTIPAEWQRYHAGSHTSTLELAALAKQARPRLLLLYHQLYWGATDADLVREIKDAGYSGDILAASDLVRVP
jgi:ribonuclease BN (tRNA processing enzyme)